ncbi:MAG TPA: GTPase HflX [Candidatus Hydrogenedentes bacterium]|nr:GTPase HflX [Candidatus Hydrogenedentota bacterium]
MPKNEKDHLIELPRPPIVEKVILATLALPPVSGERIEESLDELAQLAWTAGATVTATIVQHRPKPCPATLLGKGKLEEIKAMVAELGIDALVFDGELTARQGAHIEDTIGCKVIDRTQLILDIFAQHAHTREGKLQVELAQLSYILPRLAGRGSIMRQQGGIGVRGPGEQKLEIDRRRIRERIQRLRSELDAIRRNRLVQRKTRERRATGKVVLVGYTNAGKSSLLNALTGAGVLVEDKLFATLDPRVRKCALPSGRTFLLADTVGFVRKLPHTLVAAFRATLEVVNEADLLLLVIDAAHPAAEDHVRAVHSVLEEINALDRPIVKVYNKIDMLSPERVATLVDPAREAAVAVSAKTGTGLDALLELLDRQLATTRRRVRLRIPQCKAAVIARIHRDGRVISKSYEGDDILLDAELEESLHGQLREYVGA